MTTKIRPSTSQTVDLGYYKHVNWRTGKTTIRNFGATTFPSGNDSITYDDGRKVHGLWPWKHCVHEQSDRIVNPVWGKAHVEVRFGAYDNTFDWTAVSAPSSSGFRPLPSSDLTAETLQKVTSQIDLNSSDAVLLYSGVIQAIPLVGSVFALNSILKKAVKNLTKEFRRKPFTTVVKSLIQADFIDRFVVSPMIADAQKFQQATDYVINVINTARVRNSAPFALSSESSLIQYDKSSTVTSGQSYGVFSGIRRTWTQTTCKAFALLEARYDADTLNPLRIWANRVGLTRPLDSAWDLVPFSFVIDYFTRAGDFISHLSDEMSSVDGLRGRITNIRDLWYTVKQESNIQIRATDYRQQMYTDSVKAYEVQLGTSFATRQLFKRYRVPNAWSAIMSALERKEDYTEVTVVPSRTKLRTIAELVIQAKF